MDIFSHLADQFVHHMSLQ